MNILSAIHSFRRILYRSSILSVSGSAAATAASTRVAPFLEVFAEETLACFRRLEHEPSDFVGATAQIHHNLRVVLRGSRLSWSARAGADVADRRVKNVG